MGNASEKESTIREVRACVAGLREDNDYVRRELFDVKIKIHNHICRVDALAIKMERMEKMIRELHDKLCETKSQKEGEPGAVGE